MCSSKQAFQSLRRCRCGAVVVEFALIFPILVLMIYAIFETGRGVWQQNVLQLAAEEAGRFAMVNPTATPNQITAAAQAIAVGVDPADMAFTITFEPGADSVDFLVIDVQMPYTMMIGGLVQNMGLPPIVLRGRSRVPIPQ